MNRTSILLISAILTAGIVFSILSMGNGVKNKVLGSDTHAVDEKLKVQHESRVLPASIDSLGDQSKVREALSAGSYGALRNKIAQSPLDEGEKYYVLSQAANLCDASHLKSATPNNASFLELKKFADRFCKDFDGSSRLSQDDIPDGPVTYAYGAASLLYESIDGSTKEKSETVASSTKILSDLMLSSDSGFQGVIAAEALQQVGYVDSMVRTVLKNNESLSQEDITKAQLLSAQMRMCDGYGGCGPSQVITMQICNEARACSQSTTAQDVWRKIYSPAIYSAAQEINNFLIQNR